MCLNLNQLFLWYYGRFTLLSRVSQFLTTICGVCNFLLSLPTVWEWVTVIPPKLSTQPYISICQWCLLVFLPNEPLFLASQVFGSFSVDSYCVSTHLSLSLSFFLFCLLWWQIIKWQQKVQVQFMHLRVTTKNVNWGFGTPLFDCQYSCFISIIKLLNKNHVLTLFTTTRLLFPMGVRGIFYK